MGLPLWILVMECVEEFLRIFHFEHINHRLHPRGYCGRNQLMAEEFSGNEIVALRYLTKSS